MPITRGGLTNEVQHERQQELMTDSYISQSRHVDLGRELERWVPDESDPGSTDLENIFDGSWNRLGASSLLSTAREFCIFEHTTTLNI